MNRDLESDIINFLGVAEDKVVVDSANLLDDAPVKDLLGEGETSTHMNVTSNRAAQVVENDSTIHAANEQAAKIEGVKKAKRDTEANELKNKNAMPAPPPRADTTHQGKHVRLGNLQFTTEQVNGNVVHAHLSLSGRDIHGKTLVIDDTTTMTGALHMKGDGEKITSKITNKDLSASMFVNKKDVKSCGIAVGNEGGFFDHNDGFITYEPLSSNEGLKVNSNLHVVGSLVADAGIAAGGSGTTRKSHNWRNVQVVMNANKNDVHAGGIAVSNTGGFFDFKDDAITYEPLDKAGGLNVNAPFKVMKAAEFEGDVLVKGDLHIDGHVNFGVKASDVKNFDAKFAEFHQKNNQLESRVAELESTNSALLDRLERMETMMQEMMQN